MKLIKIIVICAAATLFFMTGCTDEEPTTADTADTPVTAPVEAPKVDLSAAPAPVAPPTGAAPAAPEATTAFGNGTAEEGLPMTDDEGKELNSTLAKLQFSVDSYYRVFDTQVADDDSPEAQARLLPELKSLEQLVKMRYLRAIPQAPDGRKYVLDAGSRKVKVQ